VVGEGGLGREPGRGAHVHGGAEVMRAFLRDWREYSFHTAVYNAVFMWLHKHDDHVRVW
jgi:hypothetical protein